MGEGQPRYNTELTKEYYYKYRPHQELKIEMLCGSDKDLQQRTWTGFKYGVVCGALASAMVFNFDEGPFAYSKAFERCFRHGTPWVISGTVYGLTVSTVANLRGKDDSINHVLGGLASGIMMGSWYNNRVIGGWGSLLFVATGGIMKLAAEHDYLPKLPVRKPVALNMYRTGWFTERPNPEGIQDEDKDDSYQKYRPQLK